MSQKCRVTKDLLAPIGQLLPAISGNPIKLNQCRSDQAIRRYRRKLQSNDNFIRDHDYVSTYHPSNSRPKYLYTENGAEKLALLCPNHEAKVFLESRGAAVRVRSRIESHVIGIITAALEGLVRYQDQYIVDGYRIDLYLPDERIAIECDEEGHKYRPSLDEQYRSKYIENKLSCELIRFNPDDPNFNVGRVINEVFKRILANASKQ